MITKTTRRRLNCSEKARILEACERSGLTRKAFAVQQGIALSSLYQWQRLSRRRGTHSGPKWIEVPNLMTQSSAVAPYRLQWPDGRALEIARPFDLGEVRALVQLLQSL